MPLTRKLKQIWAVLRWDDAIVYRKRPLDAFLLSLSPSVTGYNGGAVSCQECGAMWSEDGTPVASGHWGWCSASRIQRQVQLGAHK